MYVCLCNRVTDRELLDAAEEAAFEMSAGGGAALGERVADRVGAGIQCGTCRDYAVALVEGAVANTLLGRVA